MMDRTFLGKGWSFPPAFNQTYLGVEMLAQEADIVSSLEVLLTTSLGERVMLPKFGCNLNDLLFESLNTRMKVLMESNIESAILYHEARIKLEQVRLLDSEQNEGVILIDIVYRVKSTNSRFNFVYPYYKLEGTDINLAVQVNQLASGD